MSKSKASKLSRVQAANQIVAAVSGKTTLAALAEKADELFVEGGGESKIRQSAHLVKRALETAEAMGAVKLTRPTDVMVEKAKK